MTDSRATRLEARIDRRLSVLLAVVAAVAGLAGAGAGAAVTWASTQSQVEAVLNQRSDDAVIDFISKGAEIVSLAGSGYYGENRAVADPMERAEVEYGVAKDRALILARDNETESLIRAIDRSVSSIVFEYQNAHYTALSETRTHQPREDMEPTGPTREDIEELRRLKDELLQHVGQLQ